MFSIRYAHAYENIFRYSYALLVVLWINGRHFDSNRYYIDRCYLEEN